MRLEVMRRLVGEMISRFEMSVGNGQTGKWQFSLSARYPRFPFWLVLELFEPVSTLIKMVRLDKLSGIPLDLVHEIPFKKSMM